MRKTRQLQAIQKALKYRENKVNALKAALYGGVYPRNTDTGVSLPFSSSLLRLRPPTSVGQNLKNKETKKV